MPRTHMDRDQYAAYLLSDPWQATRDRFIRRRGNDRCAACATRAHLDVHHRTYDRLGHERMRDLVRLCHGCHLAMHDELRASDTPVTARATNRWIGRHRTGRLGLVGRSYALATAAIGALMVLHAAGKV